MASDGAALIFRLNKQIHAMRCRKHVELLHLRQLANHPKTNTDVFADCVKTKFHVKPGLLPVCVTDDAIWCRKVPADTSHTVFFVRSPWCSHVSSSRQKATSLCHEQHVIGRD
jgi:hypothetical protein